MCVYDTVVSDDDTDGVNDKISITTSSGSSTSQTMNIVEVDHSSYAYISADLEKLIESDQQLFLDDIPNAKNNGLTTTTTTMKGRDGYNHHHGDNNIPTEYKCNVKDVDEDDTFMANFLTDAFLFNHEDDVMMFELA